MIAKVLTLFGLVDFGGLAVTITLFKTLPACRQIQANLYRMFGIMTDCLIKFQKCFMFHVWFPNATKAKDKNWQQVGILQLTTFKHSKLICIEKKKKKDWWSYKCWIWNRKVIILNICNQSCSFLYSHLQLAWVNV